MGHCILEQDLKWKTVLIFQWSMIYKNRKLSNNSVGIYGEGNSGGCSW